MAGVGSADTTCEQAPEYVRSAAGCELGRPCIFLTFLRGASKAKAGGSGRGCEICNSRSRQGWQGTALALTERLSVAKLLANHWEKVGCTFFREGRMARPYK